MTLPHLSACAKPRFHTSPRFTKVHLGRPPSGNLDTNFGRHVVGAAVASELEPLVLAAIVRAYQHHHLHETILTVAFFAVAVGAILAAQRMRSRRLTVAGGLVCIRGRETRRLARALGYPHFPRIKPQRFNGVETLRYE